jgi:hypothetical protein
MDQAENSQRSGAPRAMSKFWRIQLRESVTALPQNDLLLAGAKKRRELV